MISPVQPASDNTYSNRGLIMRLSNEQIDEQERHEAEAAAQFAQNNPVVTSLAGHINMCWSANKTAKMPVETILFSSLRARKGEYDPDILAQIQKQGDTDPIYMLVTDIKCTAAESWIRDIMLPAGERPFRIDPTPRPEIPLEMQEYAKSKVVEGLQTMLAESGMAKEQIGRSEMIEVSERVKKEIQQIIDARARTDSIEITEDVNDELVEGQWYKAMSEFIEDVCTYPAAFLHGPIVRKKRVLSWEQGPEGQSIPKISMQIVREYERVSPFDIYPSAGAKSVQHGNLIHRLRFSRKDLNEMIGVDGFDDEAIRLVLDQFGAGGLKHWLYSDHERGTLEEHHSEDTDPETRIDCLKFMGSVQGKMLLEWGMNPEEVPDPDIDYEVIAYLIGSYVISARLNPHPLGRRRYYSASFRHQNDSIWGKGPPQIMTDTQRVCNSCARAIVKNMGIASGPQVWMIADRMPPDEPMTTMYPWKVWKFTSQQASSAQNVPMGFFQPREITEKLLSIYKFFYDQASEITGIPAFIYGSEKIGGAGKTASGLGMLMNAAAKGLKQVVGNIDLGAVKPSVEEHWLHIMLTEPERAKGDCKIVARASDYLIQMEQLQALRNEFLASTANPIDMQIIGIEGRAEVLRENVKTLKMNPGLIVPDRDQIVNQSVQQQVQQFVMTVSNALGIPPQQLMQIAQQGAQGGQPQ